MFAAAYNREIPIERVLAGYCRLRRLRFTVDGDPQAALHVLSPEGFLPVVVVHAEMSANEALRAITGRPRLRGVARSSAAFPLGSQLREDPQALFNVFALVRPVGAGTLPAFHLTMFLHGFNKVFGWEPNREIECAGVFNRYGNGGLRRAIEELNHPKESPWPHSTRR